MSSAAAAINVVEKNPYTPRAVRVQRSRGVPARHDPCYLLGSPERMARHAQRAREFAEHMDFATPFARVARAFEALPLRLKSWFDWRR